MKKGRQDDERGEIVQNKRCNRSFFLMMAITSFFLVGCATTPNIGYVSKSPKQASKNISVQVSGFDDKRSLPEKGKLGGRYNEYGMKVGDILEPKGLVEELRNAFVAELGNAGYGTSGGHDMVLIGEVLLVTCDQKNSSQTANVRVRLILTDKGHEVLDSVYLGESKVPFTFDITGSDAFNDAIRKVVSSFVRDLDGYVKT